MITHGFKTHTQLLWYLLLGVLCDVSHRRDGAISRYAQACRAAAHDDRRLWLPLSRLMRTGATRVVIHTLQSLPQEQRKKVGARLIDLLPLVNPGAAVIFLHSLADMGILLTGKRRQVLAWHYGQSGYYREALDVYREVLCQAPESIPALYGAAHCSLRMKRVEEAQAALTRLLQIWPDHIRGLTLRGWLLMRQGAAKEAAEVFENIVARRTSVPHDVWAYLGWCHLQTGRLRDAETAYSRALRLGDNELTTLTNLGHIKIELGKYRQAMKLLRRAAKIDPESSTPHFHMADLYTRRGRTKQAEIERVKIQMLTVLPRQ